MEFDREEFIEIPGFSIAAKLWGPESGHPVLALHGWLDNAASFDPLLPLIDAPLRVVAVDSPGSGKSSHDSVAAVPALLDEVFWMFALADALGWKEFSLLGHSRGSVVAALMATAAPERVKRVALLEALGAMSQEPEKNVQQLRTSLSSYLGRRKLGGPVYEDLDAAARVRMKGFPLDFENAKLLAARGTQRVKGGVTWTFDRRHLLFRAAVYPTEDQVLAYLGGIEAPVCVIGAEDGLAYPPDVYERRFAALKNAERHVVPGRHHVHMDAPEQVAPILTAFFS